MILKKLCLKKVPNKEIKRVMGHSVAEFDKECVER